MTDSSDPSVVTDQPAVFGEIGGDGAQFAGIVSNQAQDLGWKGIDQVRFTASGVKNTGGMFCLPIDPAKLLQSAAQEKQRLIRWSVDRSKRG